MSTRRSILLFAAAITIFIQAPGFAQTQVVGLAFGKVTLTLGLTRDKAVSLIAETGYKTLEIPPEGKNVRVAITHLDLTNEVQRNAAAVANDGILYFQNGRLVRILLDISGNVSTERDLAFSLYGAIQRLEKKKAADHCTLRTDSRTPDDEPSIDVKTTSLICPEGNAYHAIHLHWVTSEKMQEQLPVTVLEELWW